MKASETNPEALAALSTRGPEVLRPPFARFAAEYRSSGRFGACLDRLKDPSLWYARTFLKQLET